MKKPPFAAGAPLAPRPSSEVRPAARVASPRILVLAAVTAGALLIQPAAFAQTRTFTSLAGSYNWSDSAVWSGASVPDTVGESAAFPNVLTGGNVTITQDVVGLTIGGISFLSGTPTASSVLTIAGNAITLGGAGGINRGNAFASTVNINTDIVLGGNSTQVQGISSFQTMNINGAISGNTLTMGAAAATLFSGNVTTSGLVIRGSTTSSGQAGNFRAANVNVLAGFTGPIVFQGNNTLSGGQGGNVQTLWTSGTGTVASALDFGGVNTTITVNATSNTTGTLQLAQARGGVVDYTTNSITNGTGDRALRLSAIATGSGNATIRFSGSSWNITRNVELGSTGANTSSITVDFANTSGVQTISGNISNTAGGTGTSVLSRSGVGGTTILSGTNTYAAETSVTGGKLLFNGDSSGITGAVTVGAAGTLGGNGTIGGATTISGSLEVGNLDASTLTFTNGLNVANVVAGGLFFDLGTSSDLVVVSFGTLEVGTLSGADFTFAQGAGFGAPSYTLFTSTSLSGTVDGTSFDLGGGYTGTLAQVGNDVVLNVAPIPEPSTWALLLVSVFGLVVVIRRRRAPLT